MRRCGQWGRQCCGSGCEQTSAGRDGGLGLGDLMWAWATGEMLKGEFRVYVPETNLTGLKLLYENATGWEGTSLGCSRPFFYFLY